MKCADVKKLIDTYTDGALSSAERKRIDAHLSSCPSCAREFAGARALAKALRGMPVIRAPKGFEVRLDRKLGRDTGGSLVSRIISLPLHVKIPAAAAAVVVVGLSAFLLPGFFPEHDQRMEVGLVDKVVSKDKSVGGYVREDSAKPGGGKEPATGGRIALRAFSDESAAKTILDSRQIDMRLAMNIDETDDRFGSSIVAPAENAEIAVNDRTAATRGKNGALEESVSDAQKAAKADKKIASAAEKETEQKDISGSAAPLTQETKQAQAPRRSLDDIVLSNGGQVISQKPARIKEEERKNLRKAKSVKQKQSNKQNAQRTYNVQIRLPAKQYKNFVKDLSGVGKVDQQAEKVPEKGSVDINLEVTE